MRGFAWAVLALLCALCVLGLSPARAAAVSAPRFELLADDEPLLAEAELLPADDAAGVQVEAEHTDAEADVGLVEVDAAADVSAEVAAEADAAVEAEAEAGWPWKKRSGRIAAAKRARSTRIVPIIDDTGSAVHMPRANLTQFKVKPIIDASLVLDDELTKEPVLPWQRPPSAPATTPAPVVAAKPVVAAAPPAVPAAPAAPAAAEVTPASAGAHIIPSASVLERLADTPTAPLSAEAADLKLDSDFQAWMVRFGRVYSGAEAVRRQAVYLQNMERAKQQTAQSGAKFSVEGPYADMEQSEYVQLLKAHTDVDPKAASLIQSAESSRLVDGDILFEAASGAHMRAAARQLSVDWRSVSTNIKSQKTCGASWALAAAAVVESAVARAGGNLIPLSAQQLLDCNREGQSSCQGGSVLNALAFWQNHGPTPAESYGWAGEQGQCANADGPARRVATTGFALPPCVTGDCKEQSARETELIDALAKHGPLAIMLDASQLQLYQNGVVDARTQCGSQGDGLNHAAVLVGYNPQGYWLVRFSFGDSWGEAGYVRLAFGSNVCGVANYPSFVTLA